MVALPQLPERRRPDRNPEGARLARDRVLTRMAGAGIIDEAEIARAHKQGRTDLPSSMTQARAMLDEVRRRGSARVVDVLLPGIVGFCAPVFDSDGHMVLGMVALGPTGAFDPAWDGGVDTPLRAAAAQLSSDLGFPG